MCTPGTRAPTVARGSVQVRGSTHGYNSRVSRVELRVLHEMEELVQCEDIELRIWGRGVTPPPLLRATTHAGGLAIGAYVDGAMAGFVYGFVGLREFRGERRLLHHSHVLGVLPEHRRLGLGTALKLEQARQVREQGIGLMTWTFDPLRGRNAHLNLEKLGATAGVYEVKHYGEMNDVQNGNLDSDRLLVTWWLDEAGHGGEAVDMGAAAVALARRDDGGPGEVRADLEADTVLVATPADLDALIRDDPETATAWRESVRAALVGYFARGYEAARFADGSYVLRRTASD